MVLGTTSFEGNDKHFERAKHNNNVRYRMIMTGSFFPKQTKALNCPLLDFKTLTIPDRLCLQICIW
jgi:hypothetical protein